MATAPWGEFAYQRNTNLRHRRATLNVALNTHLDEAPPFPEVAELDRMAARFALAPLSVDISHLDAADRTALATLIEAARVVDDIFLEQLWSGNEALLQQLRNHTSPLGKARLRMFSIYKGPWSDLEDHRAFLPGVPSRKPLGANFYPEDMSRDEFETWLASLPQSESDAAKSFFTVIRRAPNTRDLTIVPYHRAYTRSLERAAVLLRKAASETTNASLQRFPKHPRRRVPDG